MPGRTSSSHAESVESQRAPTIHHRRGPWSFQIDELNFTSLRQANRERVLMRVVSSGDKRFPKPSFASVSKMMTFPAENSLLG